MVLLLLFNFMIEVCFFVCCCVLSLFVIERSAVLFNTIFSFSLRNVLVN